MESLLILQAHAATSEFKLLLDDNKLVAIYNILNPLIATFKPIAIMGFILVIFQEMGKMSIGGERMDVLRIGRYLFMLVLFNRYSDVVTWTNHLSNAIIESYKTNQEAQTTSYMAANSSPEIAGFITSEGILQLFHLINSGLLTDLVRWVMLSLRDYMVMFLMATGPITFALALIPGFGDGLMKKWFSYYIGVLLWGLTYFILHNMSDLMSAKALSEAGNNGNSQWDITGSLLTGMIANIPEQIGIMIMYIMAPYLTSKLMQGQPSSIASRMIGTATAAAGIAAKVVSGGTSIASGAAGMSSGAGGGGGGVASAGASSGGGKSGGGGQAYSRNNIGLGGNNSSSYSSPNKTKE